MSYRTQGVRRRKGDELLAFTAKKTAASPDNAKIGLNTYVVIVRKRKCESSNDSSGGEPIVYLSGEHNGHKEILMSFRSRTQSHEYTNNELYETQTAIIYLILRKIIATRFAPD